MGIAPRKVATAASYAPARRAPPTPVMSSLATFVLVYLLGGLTFVPLVAALLFAYAYHTFPEATTHEPSESDLRRDEDSEDIFKTDDEKLVRRLANSVDVVAGNFAVTREFVPGGVNGKPPERTSPVTASAPSDSPSVYQSMYRSLFDRKVNQSRSDIGNGGAARPKRTKNEFFVVLRHGHLMLYDDAEQTEVRHVIALNLYKVSVYGGGKKIPEGELYIRRNAIRLQTDSHDKLPFYLFCDNCSLKEDFYLALLKHQERDPDDPTVPPRPLRYSQKDIISLVQRLHSSEDHLQMNWINGLLGRIFLALYKTADVEKFIRSKIIKKIQRVNKPNFLSDIKVQHIYVGDGAPYITNPRLKEMTADGDFCVEADVTYTGNFRLTIATKATMNLGARFKPREVNLVLAVILKRLEGHGMVKIKPPPSNRLWFTFESMPKMELVIEPVVGSRQLAWGPVLRIIEGRIREVVAETVVFPQFDDIPFTDTIHQRFRGGVWEDVRPRKPPPKPADNDSAVVDDDDDVEGVPDPGLPKAFSTSMLPDTENTAVSSGFSDSSSLRSPSIRSSTSGKHRTGRAPSFNSVAPPAPLVGTDAVNVTATRGQSESESADATATVMAIRSRSSSSPQSSPLGASDLHLEEDSNQSTPTRRHIMSTSTLDGYDGASTPPASIPSTPVGSISGGSSHSFGSTNTHLAPVSRSSTAKSSLAEKPSIVALTTAAASVKKWYKNRNSTGSSFEDLVIPEGEPERTRSMPPSTIPVPPPAKQKSSPIDVPKRKSLPPPALPARRRQIPNPPLPPRRNTSGFVCGEDTSSLLPGGDHLLVVAAPDSEPSSPAADDGGFSTGIDSASGGSQDSPRRGRDYSESWERDMMRERAREDTEVWHAAEEAEHRTKVPWEPDEL